MKKAFFAGILSLVFLSTSVPLVHAEDINYAVAMNPTPTTNAPSNTTPNNNGVKPFPSATTKKPQDGSYKPKRKPIHRGAPATNSNGNQKQRPFNKKHKTYPKVQKHKTNPGIYKPSNPTGVYKPNKPNNGTYKPVKPSTGSRTKAHGPHWCYGACSLHDAGLHNAPRTQKHWCDGYR